MPAGLVVQAKSGSTSPASGRQVLLAVKHDEASATRLTDFAVRNLIKPGDTVHVLTVLMDTAKLGAFAGRAPWAFGGQGYNGPDDAEVKELDKWLREHVGTKLEQANVTYHTHIHFQSVDENGRAVGLRAVGRVIDNAARALGAAVICVGGTPHRIAPSWLVGHTEEYLMRHSDVPVMEVPVHRGAAVM